MLGDFEIRKEIGRGGMGTVYEAWQRSLQRIVAVKVLGQQVSASTKAVIRFQREAQAAAKLHHAHIVPIFGLGEDNGVYYYAMEYVDGPGLNAIIKQVEDCPTEAGSQTDSKSGSSDLAETILLDRSGSGVAIAPSTGAGGSPSGSAADGAAPGASSLDMYDAPARPRTRQQFVMVARHMATIAGALDYAHGEGVIHRDIKPHNLLLGTDGKLRISDFGLARLAEQPGVTMTGELIGSPLYMSSEQISGDSAKVDHRTDIYSLGATMYEWIASKPPYPGDTREQVISRILTTEPINLREHNAHVPIDLETICHKAIETDPNQRYQTAGAMHDDLRRFIDNHPIKARRAGVATKLRKFVLRHQLMSLASAASFVALVLVWALFSTRQQVSTQQAVADEAKQDVQRLLDDFRELLPPEIGGPLRLAEAAIPVIGQAVGVTGSAAGGPVKVGPDVAKVATHKALARRAARDFYTATTDKVESPSDGADGESCIALTTAPPWGDSAHDGLEPVSACVDQQPAHVATRRLRAALAGWFGQAGLMLDDAEVMVRLQPANPDAYAYRSLAQTMAGRGEAGVADLNNAVELAQPGAWMQVLRGLALGVAGRDFEAISDFDDALEDDPDMIVGLLGRAAAKSSLGDKSGAVTDLTSVLEIEPNNADVLALRGDHNLEQQNYEAAAEDFNRAMEIAGRTPTMLMRYLYARSQRGVTVRDKTSSSILPVRPGDADALPAEAPRRSLWNWITRTAKRTGGASKTNPATQSRTVARFPRLTGR